MGNERPKPGPYKCMLTLTSKTRFGVMRGCQEQNREGDLGGSPVFGWTGRPKADNILLVRWGVTHTHARTHTHTHIYIYIWNTYSLTCSCILNIFNIEASSKILFSLSSFIQKPFKSTYTYLFMNNVSM
jgi:hypothetical protein